MKKNQTKISKAIIFLFFTSQLLLSCSKTFDPDSDLSKAGGTMEQNNQSNIEDIDTPAILNFTSELTSLYEEISNLEEGGSFCALKDILSDESLTDEDKLAAMDENNELDGVFSKLLEVNDFMDNNSTLISNIYTTDNSQEKSFFIEKFTQALGMDVAAPNADPCSPYWAARRSCAYNYIGGVLVATEAGPLSPLAWVVLTGLYLDCLDNADNSYPACASSSLKIGIMNTIIEKHVTCE